MKIQDLQNRLLDQVATGEDLQTLHEQLPSQTSSSQLPTTDSFETASQSSLDQLTDTSPRVSSGLDSIRASVSEIRDAVVGQTMTEAGRALSGMVERLLPSIDAVQSIQQQRMAVEQGVAEVLQNASSDALEQLKVVEDSPRILLQSIQNVLDPDNQRAVFADIVDTRNTLLNSVAQAGASAFLEHRAFVLGRSHAFEQLADTLLPVAHAVPFVGAWCLSAIAASAALDFSVQTAQAIDDGAGLLTRDRIDAMLNDIDPNKIHEFEAGISINLAKGLGFGVQGSAGYSLQGCSSDPNRVLFTLTGQSAGSAGVGKGAQDYGITLGAGAGLEAEKVFAFDISSERERQLLTDFLLASQSSLTPSNALVGALEDHLVRSRVQGGPGAQGKFLHKNILSASVSARPEVTIEQRAEGTVQRQAVVYSGNLNVGANFGHLPQDIAGELPFFEQTGGDIGLYLSLASQVTIGREFVDDRFQRVIFELQFRDTIPGLDREHSIRIAIDRPENLSQDLRNVFEASSSDPLDFDMIAQSFRQPASTLIHTLSIASSETNRSFDGAGVDAAGIKMRTGTTTLQTETTVHAGQALDRSPPPSDPAPTQVREFTQQIPM